MNVVVQEKKKYYIFSSFLSRLGKSVEKKVMKLFDIECREEIEFENEVKLI